MSVQIILSILVGLAAVLGLLYVVNTSLERNRQKRQKQLSVFSDTAIKIQRVLDYIPDAYVDPELRLILLNEVIRSLQSALQIAPAKESIKASLQTAEIDYNKAKEKKARAKPALPTKTEEAADLRKRIMDLFKLVQWLQKNKRIEKPMATKHLKLLKRAYVELGATTQIIRAKVALADKNHRLGLHFYQKALAGYKQGDAAFFDTKIKELSALIIKTQAEIETSKAAPSTDLATSPLGRFSADTKKLPQTKKSTEGNGLASKPDRFGEDTSWKKKNF